MAREATPVRLSMKADGLELVAVTQDVGQAHEEFDAKYEGTELTVAFNPEYLLDGVEVAPGDEVTIETVDALKPAVIRSTEGADFLTCSCRSSDAVSVRRAAHGDRSGSPTSVRTRSSTWPWRRGSPSSSGSTAQGKTNLLEALGYLATLSSFRGTPTEALVRHGADAGGGPGRRRARRARGPVEAELAGAGRNRVLVNRQRLRRARDLLGALRVTVFSPDDLELVKGGPAERRRLPRRPARGDRIPATTRSAPTSTRVLKQRNALLSRPAVALTPSAAVTLDVWDASSPSPGEALADARPPRRAPVARRSPPPTPTWPARPAEVSPPYEAPLAARGLAAALAAPRRDELRRGV